jgi:hypothetical protein
VKGKSDAPPHVFPGLGKQRLHEKSSAALEASKRNDLHYLNPVSKLALMAGETWLSWINADESAFNPPFSQRDGLCRA